MKQGKTLILIFVFLIGFVPALAQEAKPTEYKLLAPIPLTNPTAKPDESASTATYIPGLFRLMIAATTGLAVLLLIYAGIKYMSTDAFSQKDEAKGIIENVLWGLLLAMSSWLIINTINPGLLENFNLKLERQTTTPNTNLPAGSPSTSRSNLTTEQVASQFRAAGVGVSGPILLAGLQQKTINETIGLKRSCGCDVVVTSATGGTHASGAASHANGYKVDLRLNEVLNAFIENNYSLLPGRRSDGAILYKAPSGAIYAREGSHWDVVVSYP